MSLTGMGRQGLLPDERLVRPYNVSDGRHKNALRKKGQEAMAGANVKEFNAANWEAEVAKSDVPVLVDFWAPWCGPCRALGPTIDKLAEQYAGKVKVGKLNTDDNQDIAVKYGISGIPALLFFKGGDQPKKRLVGLQQEAAIVKVFKDDLGIA